ncbi:MAG: hypothetical protein JWR75_1216 [Devosia sp.]|nr:hypothetical protein [Devosia sp.]
MASALGAIATAIAALFFPAYAIGIGADVMFATYLAVMAFNLPRLTPAFLREHAQDEDTPPLAIFLVVLGVVAVSTVFLFLVLNDASHADMGKVLISVTSVVLGWFTVHTMAAMHYAFEFYEDPSASGDGPGEAVGGLNFPGTDDPDGVAFLYFSYVIGMTAQVSDVSITSRKMRAIATMHSIFAFFFNTVIVAATINIVVSLGS